MLFKFKIHCLLSKYIVYEHKLCKVYITNMHVYNLVDRLRPYHYEYTGSRPITEVKHSRARSVPGWVTAWEHLVL